MTELTQQDREFIQNQIVAYQQNQIVATQPESTALSAPDGQRAAQDLEVAFEQGSNPDKHEKRRIKRKIKDIWRNWRTAALDAKTLEVEKIACQIQIERAETRAKIETIKRADKIAKAEHWLKLNEGNLEEISANTKSCPHIFWYGLRRFFHHITKLTDNVPKIFKNLFWIGLLFAGIVVLKHFGIL